MCSFMDSGQGKEWVNSQDNKEDKLKLENSHVGIKVLDGSLTWLFTYPVLGPFPLRH